MRNFPNSFKNLQSFEITWSSTIRVMTQILWCPHVPYSLYLCWDKIHKVWNLKRRKIYLGLQFSPWMVSSKEHKTEQKDLKEGSSFHHGSQESEIKGKIWGRCTLQLISSISHNYSSHSTPKVHSAIVTPLFNHIPRALSLSTGGCGATFQIHRNL